MADRPGGLVASLTRERDAAGAGPGPLAIDGFIQAGGKSSRMGTNKALLEIGGRTILERVIAAAAGACARVVLVANDPETYARFGVPTVPDRYPGKAALGGIATALAEARAPRALVLACDLPFLTAEFLLYLATLEPTADVTVPETRDAGPHPLTALYARACLPHIERRIAADRLKVTGFFADVGVRRVSDGEMRAAGFDPDRLLANVNTPDELEAVRRSLGET